ncbi:MAG: hypothetical protein U9N34_05195 [Candidatus Cloacimonadota bacterium]|nr:hypothetical protein [Candidatus Cloacimonadota bacterium]
MESKKMKVFNKNADSFETPLKKVQKQVNNFVQAFLMSLEKKDNKILSNADNLKRITIFERELKKFIDNSGYRKQIEKFVSDTPKLIIEVK